MLWSSHGGDSGISQAGHITIAPDGKIYAGGAFTNANGRGRKYLARLNRDGTLDESADFGTINGEISDAIVQSDGKLVVVGDFGLIHGIPMRRIARLNVEQGIDRTLAAYREAHARSAALNELGPSSPGSLPT